MRVKDLKDGDMFRVDARSWNNVYVKIDENTVICIDQSSYGHTYSPDTFRWGVIKLGSLPHLIEELKKALK